MMIIGQALQMQKLGEEDRTDLISERAVSTLGCHLTKAYSYKGFDQGVARSKSTPLEDPPHSRKGIEQR